MSADRARTAPVDIMTLPTVLDVDDLCAVLRVGEHSVRALVDSGALRRLSYSKRAILVSRGEVLRFLEEQTEATFEAAS